MKKMKVGSKFIYCPMCLAAGPVLSRSLWPYYTGKILTIKVGKC